MSGLKRTPDQMPDAKPVRRADGLQRDQVTRFAHLLALKDSENPPKPTAMGTPFRFSDANNCARKLSYKALGVAETNPPDMSGHNNFAFGTLAHTSWQEILLADPSITVLDIEGTGMIDGITSGSIDALIEQHNKRHALELKTIGGFGYKLAVGAGHGPAEGPKADHIVQLALNARAHDCAGGTLVYISKESISVNVAKKNGIDELGRFCAEWTFTREQLEPIATREMARLHAIKAMTDAGKVAPRHIPDLLPPGARITNPLKGAWVLEEDGATKDAGTAWACGYCNFQDECATDTDAESHDL